LTSLHGSLELALLSDASVEAYHLALEQTLVEADRLVELLHWFRELGEAENPLQAGERVLLGELVMQAVEETRPLAEARGLSVVVEVSGDFAVRADSARLREVMLRVMMNALQRSPAGGRVRIALSELPGYACLSVSDQGRAAPAAELAALQAPPCPVPQFLRAAKGYHLPWAIAKRASEALGGTVQLENLAPEGCCFQIRLPLAQEAEP
jgi:signal transduction histidine kinase